MTDGDNPKTSADQRPGLSAALAGVKQHGAGILLVATRDRSARDTLIAALVEQRVHELGAAIRAVDGSGNADTPEGVLVRRIGRRLDKRGHAPRSAKRWHPQTIASITTRSWEGSVKRSSD